LAKESSLNIKEVKKIRNLSAAAMKKEQQKQQK
jgi:hypothetical protein